MQEKRPQRLAATSGQGYLQRFTTRFLCKPPNSHSNTAKGKPRGDSVFFPLLMTVQLIKTKDLSEATQSPKTNIKLLSPQSIRKPVKTLTVLGEEKCFIVNSVPENTGGRCRKNTTGCSTLIHTSASIAWTAHKIPQKPYLMTAAE